MKKRWQKRFCAALSVCLMLTALPLNAPAAESPVSLDARRQALEQKLKETEKTLAELGKESEDTEEYIETLDKKIGYLSDQYQLAKSEASGIEKRVTSLESNIASGEVEITQLGKDITALEKEQTTLEGEFTSLYDAYCTRARALYVSGGETSKLAMLLSAEGLQEALTRYQLIAAVTRRDGALLQSVKEQVDKILATRTALSEKRQGLSQKQTKMEREQAELKTEKTALLEKQESMQEQQKEIEEQQSEANEKLKALHDKTKEYGEYRDTTKEELAAIDADIAAAAKKYKKTTTTTKKVTTTTTTTAATDESDIASTTATTTTQADTGEYIHLTYPCPAYTKITCGFGAYTGHTGCDFSTGGKENQRIVAAESGTVILVRELEYSYGHYIVIQHDKTTSSGKEVYTLYAHNNQLLVSEGQYVQKGQQIAYSGSTGNSTGPHLHFEVRVGGATQSCAVNPTIYL